MASKKYKEPIGIIEAPFIAIAKAIEWSVVTGLNTSYSAGAKLGGHVVGVAKEHGVDRQAQRLQSSASKYTDAFFAGSNITAYQDYLPGYRSACKNPSPQNRTTAHSSKKNKKP